MKKIFMIVTIITLILITHISAYATNISINGKSVDFTEDSGYPFVDENNRTLVPLRVTMEAAGAYVDWNSNNQIVQVLTSHTTILVPIGKNYILNNGEKIETDTKAIIKNGRTYLPIRAVLEASNFSVDWDNKTQTVFASNYDFSSNDWIPYSTGDLSTLITNVLKGNVVYYNGQYWASPEYSNMIANEQVIYFNDISPETEPVNRYELLDW